jgi:hypothetical protein
MKFLVQVICVSEAVERREQVFEMEREHLTMETLGLGLWESKALLRGVHEFMVAEQVADDLERRRNCPDCGKRRTSKAQGSIKVKTAIGQVEVPNPRLHRCSCQSIGPSTFRIVTTWLNGQTSPELLYLETKRASLIPYAKVAELLKDVLPVADLNQETVRNHLQTIANRAGTKALALARRHRRGARTHRRRLSNRRLIRSLASGSSKSSRCSGRRGVHTCYYKHGPKS